MLERIQDAKPYSDMNPLDIHMAMSEKYIGNIKVDKWSLPAGAFGDSDGPT